MSDMNVIVLEGNLTEDPEVRTFATGALTKFRVASNDVIGKDKEITLFIDCEARDKIGDVVAKHAKRGSKVKVVGKLRMDEWVDKATGAKRSKPLIRVSQFNFGGSGKKADGDTTPDVDTGSDNGSEVPF